MTSPTDRRQAGFTLIEMMVVLVVLGLVAGLVLTRGPQRSVRLDLRTQASQIAQMLRFARGQAIATNTTATVLLDTARHSLRVGNGPEHILPAAMAATSRADPAAARLPGAIVFAPDGSASGGVISLALGSARIDIGVDWLTGRVRVADAP